MKSQRTRMSRGDPGSIVGFYLITYDIVDPRRLRRVAKTLEDFGTRAQDSVFHCQLAEADLRRLQERLAAVIDHVEDSVRYYPLCGHDVGDVKADGLAQLKMDKPYFLV